MSESPAVPPVPEFDATALILPLLGLVTFAAALNFARWQLTS